MGQRDKANESGGGERGGGGLEEAEVDAVSSKTELRLSVYLS